MLEAGEAYVIQSASSVFNELAVPVHTAEGKRITTLNWAPGDDRKNKILVLDIGKDMSSDEILNKSPKDCIETGIINSGAHRYELAFNFVTILLILAVLLY